MNTGQQQPTSPIQGIRVIDMSDGLCHGTGRILADLGAEVIKIEPAGGAPSRQRGLMAGPNSLTFAAANANKLSVTIDLDEPGGQRNLLRLARSAGLVLLGGPGQPQLPPDVVPAKLMDENPALVVMQLSHFGQTGPYRNWVATGDVLLALAGVLAQSGLPGREPLLPPEHLADATASAQAAWTAMLALWNAHVTGQGELIDFSALEATAIGLDPGYGISGSARGGADDLPWGRPDARHLYPTFRCADGWARICLLSARQWDNMLEWMGRPPELADPKYSILAERHAASAKIGAVLGDFFSTRTREQIVDESSKFGVPTAGLMYPSELFTTPHYTFRESFVDVPLEGSDTAQMPRGYFTIDGEMAGFRTPPPHVGEHTHQVLSDLPSQRPTSSAPAVRGRPFDGLRVLDLGIIVAGAEAGRLFADWGADVMKVENRKFPDGTRQSLGPNNVTKSFSRGHRNKRGLGLNLRSEGGRELFLDLARQCDVVLSNFKPGTLESLGLGYDVLLEANPRLIVADSSAFGRTGPWSKRMGYGPLVRASAGLSGLWSYPGEEDGFSDAITIYPDHIAGRFVASAVIALLIRRERTGLGGIASIAQTDVLLGQMADWIMAESINPGTLVPSGNSRGGDAPRGVYPCAGDDEWCVVDVQGSEQFRGLAKAIDRVEWLDDETLQSASGRLGAREAIEGELRSWTAHRPPRETMEILQSHGVPCGFMQRAAEFPEDPHFAARAFLRRQRQPQFDNALVGQDGEAVFSTMGLPLMGPAPVQGQHSEEVCAELLGLSHADIKRLVDDGSLEVSTAGTEVPDLPA